MTLLKVGTFIPSNQHVFSLTEIASPNSPRRELAPSRVLVRLRGPNYLIPVWADKVIESWKPASCIQPMHSLPV